MHFEMKAEFIRETLSFFLRDVLSITVDGMSPCR